MSSQSTNTFFTLLYMPSSQEAISMGDLPNSRFFNTVRKIFLSFEKFLLLWPEKTEQISSFQLYITDAETVKIHFLTLASLIPSFGIIYCKKKKKHVMKFRFIGLYKDIQIKVVNPASLTTQALTIPSPLQSRSSTGSAGR